MNAIVKSFLKGVPVDLIVGVVRQHLLGSLKNPRSKGYEAAKRELVALAKDVQEKWPEEWEDEPSDELPDMGGPFVGKGKD